MYFSVVEYAVTTFLIGAINTKYMHARCEEAYVPLDD
jgi:hypothetical protein